MEFLYALSVRKLKLVKTHYNEILCELDGQKDERIQIFKNFVQKLYDELYPRKYYS